MTTQLLLPFDSQPAPDVLYRHTTIAELGASVAVPYEVAMRRKTVVYVRKAYGQLQRIPLRSTDTPHAVWHTKPAAGCMVWDLPFFPEEVVI